MSELPKGWVLVKLGDVAKWSSGGTPSRTKKEYYGGDIPWFKTGELDGGGTGFGRRKYNQVRN